MKSALRHQFAAARRDFETPWQKPKAAALAGSYVASNTRPAPNPPPPSASATGFLHRRDLGAVDVHLRGCRGSLASRAADFSGRASLHLIAPQSIATPTIKAALTVHYGLTQLAVRPEPTAQTEPAHGLSLTTWPFQLSPAGPLPCQAAGAAPSLRCGPSGDTAAHRAALRPATGAPWRCRGPPGGPPSGEPPSPLRWATPERIMSMTSPYLLQPSTPTPSAGCAADAPAGLLFAAPSLLEVVRWIDAQHNNSLALLERTDQGWSVCLIEDDTPSPTPSVQSSSGPFDRPDRSRHRRG